MMANNNEDQPLNSTFNSGQMLSIPSQQGEPPKHSTPKRPEWESNRPLLDISSICDEFDKKSGISSTILDSQARQPTKMPYASEKELLSNYFDNELQKKRHQSSNLREPSLDVLNQCITSSDHHPQMTKCQGNFLSTNTGGKIPKFETPPMLFRPTSSASELDTISSTSQRTNLLGIDRNKSVLNFGYVHVGKSMLLRQKIWNCDNEQMRIKCTILSATKDITPESSSFEVMDVPTSIMRPGESCEISVKYTPTKVERNLARLAVERENGNTFRYSFTLIGNGGDAQLCLDANFEAGIASMPTSCQVIVIRPDIFTRFWLTFENRGQRAAFIFLIAADRRGNILSREVGREQQQVSFKPAQFVLDAQTGDEQSTSKHKKSCRNVLVRLDESFNWTLDERGDNSSTPQQNLAKRGKVLPNLLDGRDSMLSSASTTNSQLDCAFQIVAYWGEETQRQRLKWWERANRPFCPNGFRFTGQFDNERQLNSEQKRKAQEGANEDGAQEFKDALRIVKFNVVDERARTYFPSQPDAIQPLLNMYRRAGILLRDVCPSEEQNSTYSGAGNNGSTMMAFLSPTRHRGDPVAMPWPPQSRQRVFDGKDKQNAH